MSQAAVVTSSSKVLPSILVIDDTHDNICLLSDCLKPNYELLAANNGEKGLEIAHRFKPDLILTSNAKRALETSKLVAEAIGLNEKKIQIEERLYEAGVETLISEIQLLDKKYKSVLLIGHNPGLTFFVSIL